MASLVSACVAALLLLSVPGLAVTLTLGLRGSTALLWSFPTSVAIIAIAGFSTTVLPFGWGILPVLLATGVATALAAGIRWLQRRAPWEGTVGTWRGPHETATYLALAASAVILVPTVMLVFGHADAFSQTYDNYFHLSLARFFMESGEAGPLIPRDFVDYRAAGRYVYPAVWHQLVALVGILAGTPVTVATNAVTTVVAGFVWPAAVLVLVRSFSPNRAAVVATPLLASGFATFPLWGMTYGVLYPYFLAVALLPYGVSAVLQLTRLAPGEQLRPTLLIPLALVALGAMALAHPSTLLIWIVVAIFLLLSRTLTEFHRLATGQPSVPWRYILGLAVSILVALPVWDALKTTPFAWGVLGTNADAFGRFLLDAPTSGFAPSLLALVVVSGALTIIARHPHHLFVLAPAAAVLLLWIPIASSRDPVFRDFFGGGFYNDPNRIAFVFPLALIPMGTLLADAAGAWLAQRPAPRRSYERAALLTVPLLVTHLTGAIPAARAMAAEEFEVSEDSPNVTVDELAMIEDLPTFVGQEDLILTDAKTGGGLVYALEGLNPISAHPGELLSPEEVFLLDNFTVRTERDHVCHVVNDMGVEFVLDFGTDQVNMHLEHDPPRGLRWLQYSDLVTLVHEVGDTRLYEVTGCE